MTITTPEQLAIVVTQGPNRREWPQPTVILAAMVLALIAVLIVGGHWLAPYGANEVELGASLEGPSTAHLLGTDVLGQDVFSRLLVGARTTVGAALIAAICTVCIATGLALLASWKGGWIDGMLGRGADLLFSLPTLLIAVVVVGVLGGGLALAVVVLVVLNLPQNYRIIRGAALQERALPYVDAAQTLGVRPSVIMARHVLPNIAMVVATCLLLRFTFAIVELSSLAFLGLGVPAGSPDWGRTLSENQVYIGTNPWAAYAPAIAIVLTAVSANLVGDWLQDRTRRRRQNR
jgi:peptide/nickel transport system permease protein